MNKSDINVIEHLKYIDNNRIYQGIRPERLERTTKLMEGENGVPYLHFHNMEQLDFIEHGFSTRMGGVSTGIYESMNLIFSRDDHVELVQENFRRMTKALGTEPEKCVYSKQTHTVNVMAVGKQQLGMGITRERDYDNIDGLITNEPDICLVTAYADCVPLFFADPVHRCIGASHSGWRGTIGNMAQETLDMMRKQYGTNPADVYTFIGPSICINCYEVSEDVAQQFQDVYAQDSDRVVIPKDNGKYLLNLQMANYFNMIHAGVRDEHIEISDLCTCCNPKFFYSHRASQGKRGVLCGFIRILPKR